VVSDREVSYSFHDIVAPAGELVPVVPVYTSRIRVASGIFTPTPVDVLGGASTPSIDLREPAE
jgi:hypothetical protein